MNDMETPVFATEALELALAAVEGEGLIENTEWFARMIDVDSTPSLVAQLLSRLHATGMQPVPEKLSGNKRFDEMTRIMDALTPEMMRVVILVMLDAHHSTVEVLQHAVALGGITIEGAAEAAGYTRV